MRKEKKAIKAIKDNRMQFAEKMDTFLILNTNIISNRLHPANKQRIEATLTQHGEFHANCQLLDFLFKYDSGGIELSQAFHETKHKGPHHDLDLIIQNAIHPAPKSYGCNGMRESGTVLQAPNVQFSTPHQPVQVSTPTMQFSTASQPVQVSECEKVVTNPVKSRKNHLTELTSGQHEAVMADCTTSCNITSQMHLQRPVNESHIDVNKSHTVQYKVEKSKEMEGLLDSESQDANHEEENISSTTSETLNKSSVVDDSDLRQAFPQEYNENVSATTSDTMSESFVVDDSDLRQAFPQDQNDVSHEIESLKLCDTENEQPVQQIEGDTTNDNRNSQTDLKLVQNGEICDDDHESDRKREPTISYSEREIYVNPKGAEGENIDDDSETIPKQLRCENDTGYSTADSVEGARFCDDPQIFIDVQSGLDKTEINRKEEVSFHGHRIPISDVESINAARNDVFSNIVKENEVQNSAHDNSNSISDAENINAARNDVFSNIVRENEVQNSAHDNSNSLPPINRLQSCPPVGTLDGNELDNQRSVNFHRPLSLPAGRSDCTLFQMLFEKPRLSYKGISGNL